MSKIFLTCAIPQVLQDYFTKMEIEIVSSVEESDIVIVESFNIPHNYEEKGVITLTPPADWQSFIQNNGKLFLDPNLLEFSSGEGILNRFFKEEGSSIFEENYVEWTKDDSYNISNFFNTGEYLDQTVIKAADVGAPAFEVKSALTHIFTALASLEEDGVIGLPLEVTFGHKEESFAVQLHGNGTISKEVIDNLLSTQYSRKIQSSSLISALYSCDLLEVTSLESTQKFSITLNWFEKFTVEIPSLIINLASNPIETSVIESEDIDPLLIKEDEILQDSFLVEGDAEEEEESIRIQGVTQIFKDEATLVEDHSELENFVTLVKGKFEDIGDKVTIVKGGKLDIDEVVHRIAGSVEKVITDTKLEIRPLEKNIQSRIRSELSQFSKAINIPAEDLSMEEIARFQVQKMPEIIKQELKSPLANPESHEVVSLREKVKNLRAEIKALKDSQVTIEKVNAKAKVKENGHETAIRDVVHSAKDKGNISEDELESIRQSIEKEMEKKVRRIEIEAAKKEALFAREIQKAKHQSRIKEVVISKTKESFTRVLSKKDEKLTAMKQKADQLSSAAALNSVAPLTTKLKEAERLNSTLQKQVDFYKGQTTQLATNLNSVKNDSSQTEELRQLKMINQKLKGMYNSLKIENDGLKSGTTSENVSEGSSTERSAGADIELKRFRSLNQQLEIQLKEASQKIISLESKMVELSRQTRGGGDDGSKVRIGHLEASVKKLTQDTIEAKNQVNESKKEVNRLRQEKTFLQNQLDKLKKEAERAKNNSTKKAA